MQTHCSLVTVQQSTCHSISPFVWQGVDGLEQVSSSGVTGEGELCTGVCTILNHSHPRLVLANVEGPCQGADETAYVLEIFSAHAPWAVHQENQICYCADRTLWAKTVEK